MKELVEEIFKKSVEYLNSGLKKNSDCYETIEIIDWKQYLREENEDPTNDAFNELARGYRGIANEADRLKLKRGETVIIVGRRKTDSDTRSYYNMIEDVTDGESWNGSFLDVHEAMDFGLGNLW